MIASFIQVAIESFQRLMDVIHHRGPPGEQLPRVGILFMVLTIVVKAFMWVIYRKSSSSGVRAIAQDAENDVIFNIASLIFPFVGGRLGWPALDPIGGLLLSIYIIWEWIETLAETVTKLSGAAASSEVVGRALYLVSRFERVESISAIEVFHQGDQYVAETDVILPVSLGLKEAHDLGEIVTYCLESAG
jgi:divalent metal cation (Fe/Co/Zn/Cd) transporter